MRWTETASSYTTNELEQPQLLLQRMKDKVEQILIGKQETVHMALTGLLAGGHLLLEDVPGVGKTLLARAFAQVMGGEFARIQFTADMQPADVTGGSVWDMKRGDFVYQPGPIMRNVVLADEINRTMPRTQSALLEAMEERSVSVDGVTRPLPSPFMLIATQNPLHDEGTYPLPEAQLDRFIMRLSIGYPEPQDEVRMLEAGDRASQLNQLRAVLVPDEWSAMQKRAIQVHVHQALYEYVVQVANATRQSKELLLGISPRAVKDWVRASQARAYIEGRSFALPDDFKQTAAPVLAHRLILPLQHEATGARHYEVLKQLMDTVPVPMEASRTARRRAT